MSDDNWYVVDLQGTTQGPMIKSELIDMYLSEKIHKKSYIWNGKSVRTWTPISQVSHVFDDITKAKNKANEPPKPKVQFSDNVEYHGNPNDMYTNNNQYNHNDKRINSLTSKDGNLKIKAENILSNNPVKSREDKYVLKSLNIMDYVHSYRDSFFREVQELNLNVESLWKNWQIVKKHKKLSRKLRKKLGIVMARYNTKKNGKRKKPKLMNEEPNESTPMNMDDFLESNESNDDNMEHIRQMEQRRLEILDDDSYSSDDTDV
mmetsp:Transcript_39657/g.49049  ORF Transcript_39657/g.49049 Transcript_39657/m.49049 type:complete len:262 (-) Transcript_39657:30-815(-)